MTKIVDNCNGIHYLHSLDHLIHKKFPLRWFCLYFLDLVHLWHLLLLLLMNYVAQMQNHSCFAHFVHWIYDWSLLHFTYYRHSFLLCVHSALHMCVWVDRGNDVGDLMTVVVKVPSLFLFFLRWQRREPIFWFFFYFSSSSFAKAPICLSSFASSPADFLLFCICLLLDIHRCRDSCPGHDPSRSSTGQYWSPGTCLRCNLKDTVYEKQYRAILHKIEIARTQFLKEQHRAKLQKDSFMLCKCTISMWPAQGSHD